MIFRLWGSLIFVVFVAQSCAPAGPVDQPVEFSHRVHAKNKINCAFCHAGAERNAQASLPSVRLCMSCHSAIKTDSPQILNIKAYLDRGEEIPWSRIYAMPEGASVFFNHQRHAKAKIECARCHGDVASRDQLGTEVRLTMGFCVQCHLDSQDGFRDSRMATDCALCHR